MNYKCPFGCGKIEIFIDSNPQSQRDNPKSGDLSICAACLGLFAFTKKGTRPATEMEHLQAGIMLAHYKDRLKQLQQMAQNN